MRPSTDVPMQNLLTDDILVSIFEKVSIVHRTRLSRVCKRWKALIDLSFLWVTVFSAVDDRRCVTDWRPSDWLSLSFVKKDDYLRLPKVSASEILARIAKLLPNLIAIDLECCDMNNRIIRTILSSCKKVERINFDSSTRLNSFSFSLIAQHWQRLRHVNLSCCSEVNEATALFIIQNLKKLESLNLCGTKMNGKCLSQLNPAMKRLDISYCWAVQEEGLTALASAKCNLLEELSVNNLDFDMAENCMVAVLSNFTKLKHLQMSIGPCVANDYFIDRITYRGFSTIARMSDLETLIIEKICIIDNASLLNIMRNCSNLKILKLNLAWLNFCTDTSFSEIGNLLLRLEELHISYASSLTAASMMNLVRLKELRSLSLINTDIDNSIFSVLEHTDKVTSINFNECRRITLKGLNHLCRIASGRPRVNMKVSLLNTGIPLCRLRNRKKGKNHPSNLEVHVSSYRSMGEEQQQSVIIL